MKEYKDCPCVTSVGQNILCVTPACKHVHTVRGTLVTSKSECRNCHGVKGGRTKIECDAKLLKKYVHEGKTNAEIAELMDVSVTTVMAWIHQYDLKGIRKRGGGLHGR